MEKHEKDLLTALAQQVQRLEAQLEVADQTVKALVQLHTQQERDGIAVKLLPDGFEDLLVESGEALPPSKDVLYLREHYRTEMYRALGQERRRFPEKKG